MLLQSIANPVVGDVQRTQHTMAGRPSRGAELFLAGRYEFAEQEARAKRAGLWADAAPVPPWDWRKGER